jgi:hypothetical protein
LALSDSGFAPDPRIKEGGMMSDEKARKIAEEALNRLSADLEAGRSEALKNYLGAMSRFHRYSWNNVL